ncbi:MAG: hypothetical protein L6R38_005709 [Xanthoria sp. 2 TBL-2021]|nr:MAG: hypothetical protein L6R38_005709 [Xanthoria sp. 2 TBL-2021]
MPLRNLLLSCLRSFRELIRDIDAPQYSYEDEVAAASWIDELGRLRIWAGNVGAHQSGPSSLEFRLRDASHIRDEVTDLLTDLERLLDEAQEYLSAEDYEDDTSSTNDSLDEDGVTELQALFGELVTIIRCLYKLAMLIRNPAQHDFLAESYRTETVAFEPFDEQHVRNKFPQADEKILLRLAKALTRRRGYLKYRARHSMKLAKGLEDGQASGGGVAASISETMASTLQLQPVDYPENSSESGISQTSYANSILEGGVITVPAPPRDSLGGGPFLCPYCQFIIHAATTPSWHRHVFTDLRPYTCIFQPCRTPDKLYSSRRDWFGHICSTHDTRGLLCPLCKKSLGTVKQYERHVARHMEELALFVLPRAGDEDQGEGGGSDNLNFSVSDTEEHSPLGGINRWVEDMNDKIHGTHSSEDHLGSEDLCDEPTDMTATYRSPSVSRDNHQEAKGTRTSGKTRSGEHDSIDVRWETLLGGTSSRLQFGAESIAKGIVTVGLLRLQACTWQSLAEAQDLEFYFAGQRLDDDNLPCRDLGMESGSVVDGKLSSHQFEDDTENIKFPAQLTSTEATVFRMVDEPISDEKKQPIRFKDAVGRKFTFPWHLCSTGKVSKETQNQYRLCILIIYLLIGHEILDSAGLSSC